MGIHIFLLLIVLLYGDGSIDTKSIILPNLISCSEQATKIAQFTPKDSVLYYKCEDFNLDDVDTDPTLHGDPSLMNPDFFDFKT